MTPDSIFSICNSIALIGWIILITVSPFWFDTDKLLIGIIVTLFAIVYAWCISQSFAAGDVEKFSTLDGVMSLFTNKMAVTAGWVHYLAFDLMTGIWIKKNSMKYGISHWFIVPCLLFTFMLGPVGLLMYFIIRTIRTKQYFADNY
jgi:heme A synthase